MLFVEEPLQSNISLVNPLAVSSLLKSFQVDRNTSSTDGSNASYSSYSPRSLVLVLPVVIRFDFIMITPMIMIKIYIGVLYIFI